MPPIGQRLHRAIGDDAKGRDARTLLALVALTVVRRCDGGRPEAESVLNAAANLKRVTPPAERSPSGLAQGSRKSDDSIAFAEIARNRRQSMGRRGGLTSKIHTVVDTDTRQSDLGSKSTRAGADGTQARARPSRSKRP